MQGCVQGSSHHKLSENSLNAHQRIVALLLADANQAAAFHEAIKKHLEDPLSFFICTITTTTATIIPFYNLL